MLYTRTIKCDCPQPNPAPPSTRWPVTHTCTHTQQHVMNWWNQLDIFT